MPQTYLRTKQFADGGITRVDLNTATSGSAVITKLIKGTGIDFTSTGADSGTGDVTIALEAIANNRFLGNISGGSAVPIALTGTQITAALDSFTGSIKALVPASAGGTTNFLRADGQWAAPSGGSGLPSLTGTANQVLVNGTSGSAVTTAATLTLPQDINTNSTTQFNKLGLGSAISGSEILRVNGGSLQSVLIDSSNTDGPGLTISNTGGSGRSYSLLSTGTTASIGAGNFALYDNTASAYRLCVDLNGNVVIGASTAPSSGLYQEKSGDSSRIRLRSYGGLGILFSEKANGTLSSPTAVTTGNPLFILGVGGYDGTAFKSNSAGGIRVLASQDWTSGAHGSYLTLDTTQDGTTSQSERVRVSQNGKVGINTQSPSNILHVVSSSNSEEAFKAEATGSSTVAAAVFTAPVGVPPIKFTNLTQTSTDMSGSVKSLVVNASGEVGVTQDLGATATVAHDSLTLSNSSTPLTLTNVNASTADTTDIVKYAVVNTSGVVKVISDYSIRVMGARNTFNFFTDFINETSTTATDNGLSETNSGTGASSTNQASDGVNVVGVARSTTGSTATGRAALSSATSIIRLGGGSWYYEAKVKIPTLSTSSERYALVIGFLDTLTAANQVDAVAFLYDEGGVSTGSTAAAYWQTVTSSNSSRTFNTSLSQVTVDTAWNRFGIEVNEAASSVSFYINGALVATHTANIPSGSGRELGFGALLIKSVGTTARTVDYDYVNVVAKFSSTR